MLFDQNVYFYIEYTKYVMQYSFLHLNSAHVGKKINLLLKKTQN